MTDASRLLRRRLHADLSRARCFAARATRRSARATAWTSIPRRSTRRVASAAPLLDGPEDTPYDAEIFVAYTRHIIEQMGGARAARRRVRARDLRGVGRVPALRAVRRCAGGAAASWRRAGVRIGLISNSHRCLASFQSHFELRGLDQRRGVVVRARLHEAAPEHLLAALQLLDVPAGEARDGRRQRAAGRRRRARRRHARGAAAIAATPPRRGVAGDHGVPVIRSLRELPRSGCSGESIPMPDHQLPRL